MPLTDSRLLGNCGRLKCCLLYEFSTYEELRARLPRVNSACQAECGGGGCMTGKVRAVRVLKRVGGRRLPRRDGGGGAARPAHVGGAPACQAARALTACFYLTTPIYYVNAPPHLGPRLHDDHGRRDGRYRRLAGDDVFFLTGTDEHGDKIAQAAAKAGETPQALADRNSAAFRETWRRARHHQRRLHPHDRAAARAGGPGDPPAALRRGRDLLRQVRRPVLLRLRAVLHREGDRRRQVPRPPDAADLHQGGELLLPDVEVPGLARSTTSRTIRTSSSPSATGTRCWASCGSRSRICRSAARRRGSSGASRCPFDDRYVTYVWFDALLNYVSALGEPGGDRFRAVLAARPAPDRQGHPEAPRRSTGRAC